MSSDIALDCLAEELEKAVSRNAKLETDVLRAERQQREAYKCRDEMRQEMERVTTAAGAKSFREQKRADAACQERDVARHQRDIAMDALGSVQRERDEALKALADCQERLKVTPEEWHNLTHTD